MSDEGGTRGSARLHRIKKSAVYSAVAKGSSLFVVVISVPAAITALGETKFNIWVTITSLISLLGFLDGGISNGIVNTTTNCSITKDYVTLRRAVSNAFFLLVACSILGITLTILLAYCTDWNWLISLPETINETDIAFAIICVGTVFSLNLPLSLASKVRHGLQETHINSIFDILASAITTIATLVCCVVTSSLAAFFIAFTIGPLLSNALNSAILYSRRDPFIAPTPTNLSRTVSLETLKIGSLFLGLQICSSLSFQIDSLILAHFVGLDAAGELAVVNRLFNIAGTITAFVTIPLWPAFREAALRGESAWITAVFRRTVFFTLAFSLALTVPALLFHSSIIQTWTKGNLSPPTPVVTAVFIWSNMLVLGGVLSALLNGLNLIKLQLLLSGLMAVLNLILSIAFVHILGACGVVIGSIVSYSICVILPLTIIYLNKRLEATAH